MNIDMDIESITEKDPDKIARNTINDKNQGRNKDIEKGKKLIV